MFCSFKSSFHKGGKQGYNIYQTSPVDKTAMQITWIEKSVQLN